MLMVFLASVISSSDDFVASNAAICHCLYKYLKGGWGQEVTGLFFPSNKG